MRTWQLFKFPGWKLGSGFKAGGRESLQTDGLWCPHMEGKRPLVPCAARLLGKQRSPDGLRAAPSRSPSCCRAQGHQAPCPGPGGTGTLAAIGPGGGSSSWGTNPSRGAWQLILRCSGSLQTRGVPIRVWKLFKSVLYVQTLLESKRVTQCFRCGPMKLGNSYLINVGNDCCCESWERSAW